MTSQVLQMRVDAYLQGIPLSEAIFKAADAESLQKYNEMANIKITALPKKTEGFGDILRAAASQLQDFQINQGKIKEIENILKNRLLKLIKNGDLMAFGFEMPRNIQDQPIKIPPDLFFGGEINWQKSELKSQNLEFSGIKIFKNSNPVIDLSPNNLKNTQKQIPDEAEKAKKPNFADLDPELHIGEKDAAKYLGISPRTLQGYRLNGGGPEYLKLKKAVRYKIRDLIEWTNANKKENTSQN
jgi:hypothetical protein